MTAELREQRAISATAARGRWSRLVALFVVLASLAAFVVEAAWRYYSRPVASVAAIEFTLHDPLGRSAENLRNLVFRDDFLRSALSDVGEPSLSAEFITLWKQTLSTDYATADDANRRVFLLRHAATDAIPPSESFRLVNRLARRTAEELSKPGGKFGLPVVAAAAEPGSLLLWRVAAHGAGLLFALSLAAVLVLAMEPAAVDPSGLIPATAALQAEASAVFESRDPPARFASADDVARSLRLPVVTYRRSTET